MTHMTHDEIRRRYRDARDKPAQIRILAELNLVSPDHIREILGLDPDFIPSRRSATRRLTRLERAERDEKFLAWYRLGRNDREIAEACGAPLRTVNDWRRGQGLPNTWERVRNDDRTES